MKVLLVFTTLLSVALAAPDIQVTEAVYPAQNDKDALCKLHFGEAATLLDFAELKAMSVDEVTQLMSDLNIGVTKNLNHYFVTINGESIFPGTNKHAYFFENHDGAPPSYFDVIDTYAGLNVAVDNKYGHLMCNVQGGAATRRALREQRATEPDEDVQAQAEPVAERKADKSGKSWWGW